MHLQYHPESGKVHTGSTSSTKYPRTVPLQGMGNDKYSPKSKDHTVFSIMLLRRGVSVMTPSYGKGSWGTELWNDLIRNIQELIKKARNPDSQAILSPALGLISQAPVNIEDMGKEREGRGREGKQCKATQGKTRGGSMLYVFEDLTWACVLVLLWAHIEFSESIQNMPKVLLLAKWISLWWQKSAALPLCKI